MLPTIKKYLLFATIGMVAMTGCDKEIVEEAPTQLMTGENSYIKVVHLSPNFTTVTGQPEALNFIVSGAKVNSAPVAYNAMFPLQTTGYLGITSGLHWFKVSRPGVNTNDSITIHTFQKLMEPGQRYSYIITDSVKSNNEKAAMLLEDNFNVPVPGNYGVRFVHAVHSDTAGKTVDVYSFRRKANIFTNIKIGTATGFVEFGPAGTDTLSVRRSGTTNELTRFNGIPFSSTRVYTVVYRGLTTATTGTKARGLMYYLNN